jgi:hypothetical protein
MKKSRLYAIGFMFLLLFIWWFSGGTLWGYARPSPAEEAATFVWKNFNTGLATAFQTMGDLIERLNFSSDFFFDLFK